MRLPGETVFAFATRVKSSIEQIKKTSSKEDASKSKTERRLRELALAVSLLDDYENHRWRNV